MVTATLMLTSTPIEDGLACPTMANEPVLVNFTCEIRGANTVTWSSNQFISDHGADISFSVQNNNEGDSRNSEQFPGLASAILTRKVVTVGSPTVLESRLMIRIFHPQYSYNASVTCFTENDMTDTISFTVIGKSFTQIIIRYRHIKTSSTASAHL